MEQLSAALHFWTIALESCTCLRGQERNKDGMERQDNELIYFSVLMKVPWVDVQRGVGDEAETKVQ